MLEEIKDRGGAAAFGFSEAQERIVEIIRSHSNDGWIYCGDGKNLPENISTVIVQVKEIEKPTFGWYEDMENKWILSEKDFVDFEEFSVIAWQHLPSPYSLQKSVGEDYKRQIMERFLKVE